MMKIYSLFILFIMVILLLPWVSKAQNYMHESLNYDSTLAKKLDADEYGMKEYVMAFLMKGPNRSQDSVQRAEIQTAHLKNIMRLAKEGKLVIAGPFLDNHEVRGIFIFNVKSLEEAKILTESDPAVRAGVLKLELHPWYGPAILPEVIKLNQKLEKKSITE